VSRAVLTAAVNMASVLTPLQITALSGLLQNQGITDAALTAAINSYVATPVIAPLISTVAVGSTGNILPTGTLTQLKRLAANACPALSDSIPTANASSYPAEFITTLLNNTADKYLGNGDVSKFAQALSVATSYCGLTNQVINSAVNSQTYLGNTFTNTNNMMSGGITAVNPCTAIWAGDLAKLGGLINLRNLDELGSPVALIKQLALIGGVTPQLALTFESAGVSKEAVVNLTSPNLTVTDADQRAMYIAMTRVTGDSLAQVLTILGVTTANITTMADLLNPVKIFPNSFQTLAVTGVNKISQNIYINATGTVNPQLEQALPQVVRTALV
jgi:hypothetical protein